MEINCSNCNSKASVNDLFCGNCGRSLKKDTTPHPDKSTYLVLSCYFSYLTLSLSYIIIVQDNHSLFTELVYDLAFIALTLFFCLFEPKAIIKLYNTTLINWKNLLFALGFPILSAGVVFVGVNWLNGILLEETYNVFEDYAGYDSPLLWATLFLVVVPAVFEELAFRGFLFHQLQKFTTVRTTILATSFLFALIHLSITSFLWIFPFGVLLGYLRHRYNTLWLGMIIHFIHNMLVVYLDYEVYHLAYVSPG